MTSAQVDTGSDSEKTSEEGYERGLGSRQVQMIAIGGAIVFFIMRALGELLLYRPVSGSFAEYSREFLGPFFGYFTGWTYWLMWVVTGMAALTAAAIYVD